MRNLRRSVLLVTLLLVLGSLTACGSGSTTPRAQKTQCTYSTDTTATTAKKADPPPGDPPTDLPDRLTISTDAGDIPVSLDVDKAPCTVNSFVSLAKQGYFDGTRCHRLVTVGIFVLQCGDPSGTGRGGPGYEFKDELVQNDPRLQPCQQQTNQQGQQLCTYTTGTLAMANGGPDTNGSQFFLVYRDSPLANGYTVFGKMSAAGVQVVQSVAEKGVGADGTSPAQPVTITSVK